MYSKKINQLATNLNPQSTDLIPIGDATTGQLKTTTYNAISGITSDGVISGGIVTWTGTGLIFNISACVYYLNGIRYSSPATTKTLDAADTTYDRIDVFAVNTSGQVEVIKGTPALNPVEPEGDTPTTLGLTNVTIAANATTPSGVTRQLIYDENASSPTEWNKTIQASVPNANFSYNAADTSQHNTGTKSLRITSGDYAAVLTFDKGSTINISDYNSISFAIRLTSAWNGRNFQLNFYNGGIFIGYYRINIINTVGFDSNLINAWQTITIPFSSINLSQNKFTNFTIQTSNPSITYYLDTICLNGGINNPSGTTSTNSFGFINGTTGTASSTQATDTLNVVGTGLATTSATGKTLTIAVPSPIPTQSGNTGKYLKTDGSALSWASVDALPSQTGNNGKYLTTNGSTASWANVDALPSQSGNTGKFLTTDGSIASWVTISTSNLYTADGTLTGNRTLSNGGFNLYLNAPVTIGGTSINSSAQFQVDSTSKGALLPRVTLTQKNAISSPLIGLLVYQTDTTEGLYQYTSLGWQLVGQTSNIGISSVLFNFYNFI